MEDLKLIFIADALRQYSLEVIAEMKRREVSLKAVDTQTLLHSFSYRVYQQSAQGNTAISFAEWGRFLDMGVTRGHPLGGISATESALRGDKKKVKPKKIYSPVAYGKLNWLIGQLAYGFTEETILQIKQQLRQDV